MSYYPDLSPYNYSHYCEKELNVGWLEKGQPFSVGEVPEGFLERLKWFSEEPFPVFAAGAHFCEFCEDRDAKSSCELRIVGEDDAVYATPYLIVHYIEAHKYLPPQEFIDAVMNGPRPGQDKYTDAVYREVLPFWEPRRPDINDEDYEEKMRTLMINKLSEEVDEQIMGEIISQNPNFQKFVEAYNKIMPAVYSVNTGDSKKK